MSAQVLIVGLDQTAAAVETEYDQLLVPEPGACSEPRCAVFRLGEVLWHFVLVMAELLATDAFTAAIRLRIQRSSSYLLITQLVLEANRVREQHSGACPSTLAQDEYFRDLTSIHLPTARNAMVTLWHTLRTEARVAVGR